MYLALSFLPSVISRARQPMSQSSCTSADPRWSPAASLGCFIAACFLCQGAERSAECHVKWPTPRTGVLIRPLSGGSITALCIAAPWDGAYYLLLITSSFCFLCQDLVGVIFALQNNCLSANCSEFYWSISAAGGKIQVYAEPHNEESSLPRELKTILTRKSSYF